MNDVRALNLIRNTTVVVVVGWMMFKWYLFGPALIFLIIAIIAF